MIKFPEWARRAVWITCAGIFLSMASTGKNKAKDTSHNWNVTGWMGRTMWPGGDKGLSHVWWEAWLQIQAESGALTTPQSATGSQFDIHHLVASASFLPHYWFSGPEVLLLPAPGDAKKLRNSKAPGDRPWDHMASYRDMNSACLLYLTGMIMMGATSRCLWMLCAQYMVNTCLLKWRSSQRLPPIYCIIATLSSWGGTGHPSTRSRKVSSFF